MLHTSSAWHATHVAPHACLVAATHWFPQNALSAAHLHVLAWQVCPPAHVVPHAPQLALSLARSTQLLLPHTEQTGASGPPSLAIGPLPVTVKSPSSDVQPTNPHDVITRRPKAPRTKKGLRTS
jgi:hypothetical protein